MKTSLWSFGFALVLSAVAGCAGSSDTPTNGGDEARGGLGKADLIGTCETPEGGDYCGGKSEGNCWCDDLCVDYGDCCNDVESICGVDDGDDDDDGEPTFCGGFLGQTCDDDEYCAYQPGQYCGAADASSTCEPRPEACIELLAPVCGCDGNTYSNSCFAAMAGTGVLSDGECPPPPPGGFCGGFAGIECPEGQVCVDDPNDDCDPNNGGADCGGICELEPEECQPVLCELFCPFGFAVDPDTGCETCSCNEEPPPSPCTDAGGVCAFGLITACPDGLEVSSLSCGNLNIENVCCAPADEPEADSCQNSCGGQSETGACWCDNFCSFYGDCCDDYADEC